MYHPGMTIELLRHATVAGLIWGLGIPSTADGNDLFTSYQGVLSGRSTNSTVPEPQAVCLLILLPLIGMRPRQAT